MTTEGREGEVVLHVAGRRVRFYAGHTGRVDLRWRRWRSGSTTGIYVRPWGTRVLGLQWRPGADQ